MTDSIEVTDVHHPTTFRERAENIRALGGIIAGVLALIIAGSICVRYIIHGAEDIPQILTYALSTIIGFYFGAGVPSTRDRRRN
jgi:hypothetical protein